MIANQVSHQSFCEDMRDWVQAQDCLAEQCTPSEHLGTFCSREDGRDCPLIEIGYKMEQAMDDHENTVIKYGCELINIVQSFKIAKCVRVSLIGFVPWNYKISSGTRRLESSIAGRSMAYRSRTSESCSASLQTHG